MSLKTGDLAPDFSATSTTGQPIKLSDLRGKRVVLYFFPKAFTTGCTLETRSFRDRYQEIKELGAEVIGISVDEHERQCEFASVEKVGFPMIGDGDKTISRAYDVLWPLLGVPKRVTFVVGKDGRIEAMFRHEINAGRHLTDVLELLRGRSSEARP